MEQVLLDVREKGKAGDIWRRPPKKDFQGTGVCCARGRGEVKRGKDGERRRVRGGGAAKLLDCGGKEGGKGGGLTYLWCRYRERDCGGKGGGRGWAGGEEGLYTRT